MSDNQTHDGEHDFGKEPIQVGHMAPGETQERECTHANCGVTCTVTRVG